jgi:putative glutamine amidotransferase
MPRPRIAVLMDENTSSGGTRYEAHKGYFHRLIEMGAAPFGVAYEPGLAGEVIAAFDALLTAGGRFAYPAAWYAGAAPVSIETTRLDTETTLVRGFLDVGKPVLGMCAGMQTLACLHGAKLTPSAVGHDQGATHEVTIAPGSRLAALVGPRITVNSYHREALAELAPGIVASAVAADGVIEAIELPRHRFAIGLQWHQELLDRNHPGQAIFGDFVKAAGESTP